MTGKIMKNNYKHLKAQLAELSKFLYPPLAPRIVFWDTLEKAEIDDLKKGERIVEDYYLDEYGKPVIIRERISADSSDSTKDFPHGSWDPKYLASFRPFTVDRIIWALNRRR
jgi:hypothetical protein